MEQVFTEAWYDVAAEFEDVFGRLFPGGEGRLILTDPQNMLTTGIDVEARPPGKKVKRLSLLSGGERALVAVTFLVALFKARPSPFYILDEVEAALDDINLGRLLEIYEELRDNSQLVVITHQKRTMEVADALYGVSMRGDGVSAVISQRLREEEIGVSLSSTTRRPYTISTRWEDEDVYGHVNNVVYYSFFDTAVNGYLIDTTGVDIRQLDTYGIVAETSCQFLRELRFPGDVDAGLKVTKLGTSSVVYEIALFQGADEEPAAVGRFVHVYVSGERAEVHPDPGCHPGGARTTHLSPVSWCGRRCRGS